MKLVIGLSNYGAEFEGTRHNVGADVIDALRSRYNIKFSAQKKTYIGFSLKKLNAALILPITGMNDSGMGVSFSCRDFDLTIEDSIVIVDDMDFEPGQVRIKRGGGPGGHNGLKSIIRHMGPEFIKVRIGIGKPKTKEQGAEFVLGEFKKSERKLIDHAITVAMGAVEHILIHGVDDAMRTYNQRQ